MHAVRRITTGQAFVADVLLAILAAMVAWILISGFSVV